MQKKLWVLCLSFSIIVCFGFCQSPSSGKQKISNTNGFAVVELFTSEGCSSCPPADELAAKIANENWANVFVLAYHVDYWDRLGWKDSFSDPAFSERQRQYARRFKLEGVYTPQMIVNGSRQFVGSNESMLRQAINHKALAANLNVEAQKSTDNLLQIQYNFDGTGTSVINFALIEPRATSNIKRGENSGKTLHHINIVRQLKTIPAKSSEALQIKIPVELQKTPLKLIAFSQNTSDLVITGATWIDL